MRMSKPFEPFSFKRKRQKRRVFFPGLNQTHRFEHVSFPVLAVVNGEFVPRTQHQLLQVQSQRPGVLRIQSPHAEQSRTAQRWRGEGAVEGLEEPTAGPLDGSGSHRGLPPPPSLHRIHPVLLLHLLLKQRPQISLRLPVAAPLRVGLFLLRACVDGGFRRFHVRTAALLISPKDGAFPETFHLTVTAPGKRKAAAPEALKGSKRAFTRIWNNK